MCVFTSRPGTRWTWVGLEQLASIPYLAALTNRRFVPSLHTSHSQA